MRARGRGLHGHYLDCRDGISAGLRPCRKHDDLPCRGHQALGASLPHCSSGTQAEANAGHLVAEAHRPHHSAGTRLRMAMMTSSPFAPVRRLGADGPRPCRVLLHHDVQRRLSNHQSGDAISPGQPGGRRVCLCSTRALKGKRPVHNDHQMRKVFYDASPPGRQRPLQQLFCRQSYPLHR